MNEQEKKASELYWELIDTNISGNDITELMKELIATGKTSTLLRVARDGVRDMKDEQKDLFIDAIITTNYPSLIIGFASLSNYSKKKLANKIIATNNPTLIIEFAKKVGYPMNKLTDAIIKTTPLWAKKFIEEVEGLSKKELKKLNDYIDSNKEVEQEI